MDILVLTACQCSMGRGYQWVGQASADVPRCATELVSFFAFFHGLVWMGIFFPSVMGIWVLRYCLVGTELRLPRRREIYIVPSVLMCRERVCVVRRPCIGYSAGHFLFHVAYRGEGAFACIFLSFSGVTSREGPMGDNRITNCPVSSRQSYHVFLGIII